VVIHPDDIKSASERHQFGEGEHENKEKMREKSTNEQANKQTKKKR
jgi:hypothetical protein